MPNASVQEFVNERALATLEKASKHCASILAKMDALCQGYLSKQSLKPEEICFVVVGSLGRGEAMEASDIDLIPVLESSTALTSFEPHDKALRKEIIDQLGIKVSQGNDLTKCVSLDELTDSETIGGDKDCSSALTKRILILTEGKQAGGNLSLDSIRKQAMKAYADSDRTRGRHVLSLCNDIARYYRTLCIEYKAKADDAAKDWCTRNMKLRHARKFWYLSCIMTISHLAETNPKGDEEYIKGLMGEFAKPPYQRLFDGVAPSFRGTVGRIIESFAWFLDFMSDPKRREKLALVKHEDRYEMSIDNPFHAVKKNSDQMHQDMLTLLESLPTHQRRRVMDWFLL